MRKIVVVATLVALAQTVAGFSSPALQTFPGATTLRRIQVNAQSIAALAPGKNYVVDLTQRGVIYEFSPQTGQIDFSRVRVRTTSGERAIGSFLETTFLKDKLAGFKYTSQSFSLVTRAPGTLQNPPSGASNIDCNRKTETCTCTGGSDCYAMHFRSDLCASDTFCAKNPITGELVCSCKGG